MIRVRTMFFIGVAIGFVSFFQPPMEGKHRELGVHKSVVRPVKRTPVTPAKTTKTVKPSAATNVVTTHVHLTCYQPVASQCDSDPTVTADGSRIDMKALKRGDLKWVAVSRDLLYLFPMGSRVRITSEATGKVYGVYQVRDKMNRRWNHRMDILISPSSRERISEANVRVELI